MARRLECPRYYESQNGWFANLDGERIRLTTGPKKHTKKEALEKHQAELDDKQERIRVGTLLPSGLAIADRGAD